MKSRHLRVVYGIPKQVREKERKIISETHLEAYAASAGHARSAAKPSSVSMHMPSPRGGAGAVCLSRSVKGMSGARDCCCEENDVDYHTRRMRTPRSGGEQARAGVK
jgi:hypothetical protein